ncbi:recombination protein NinB [Bradyrhizobium sp. SZCCHNR2026]|uniref:recombination protein NinB n=1 Tax=Bradyrhizobium sp. SZCCHNR2026 TaxID=3057381 RepID=UPI002916804D|nr:recombination protein NinB [Bradyrhizobium sp. SZCCHNR2026]
MSGRPQIVIRSQADRALAHRWIDHARPGTRIEFKAAQRTVEQNDRMWAMLTDIARQAMLYERRYTTDQWKVIFLHACGQEIQHVPSLSGGFIPYGQSSSDLSKEEMSNLIEFMFAWGAENGVVWSDPKQAEAQ